MTQPKNNVLYRVSELEKNYQELDKKLDQILQNELPHIQEELTSLKTRIMVMTTMNIGALLLVGLLVFLIQK